MKSTEPDSEAFGRKREISTKSTDLGSTHFGKSVTLMKLIVPGSVTFGKRIQMENPNINIKEKLPKLRLKNNKIIYIIMF